MTVYELIQKRRTIRRFEQKPVPEDLLERCVNAARIAPSGGNLQPLEYIVVSEPEQCQQVFPHTAWAGYLPDWSPGPEERPMAYIFILTNREVRANAPMDVGIAAENITLVALAEGVGSCIVGSLDEDALHQVLAVPHHCDISLTVALGYPAEQPRMVEMNGDSIKYYRDEDGTLEVPKRALADVLHWQRYSEEAAQ